MGRNWKTFDCASVNRYFDLLWMWLIDIHGPKAYFRKFWLWIIDALIFDCGLAWHVSYLHVKGLLPRTKQSNIYTVLCFEIKWLIYWLIDWTIRSYDGSATWNLLYLHSEITNYLVLNHKSVSLAMLQCGCDCAL